MDLVAAALREFFTPEPVFLDRGRGFATFGPEHMLVLAVCLTCAAVLVRRYRRLPRGLAWGSPRRRMLLVTSVVPLALLVSRDVAMVALGIFHPIFWPLHICNMCEVLALFYALTCSSRVAEPAGELLFAWGATGGISALLFPGWTYCPMLTYASLGGFAEHALLLVTVWAPVLGGDFVPSVRRSWMPALFALVVGGVYRLTNPIFGTNFFFVTQPLDNPPFRFFFSLLGNPGYLIPYGLLAYCTWLLWYAVARKVRPAQSSASAR